MIRGHRQDDGLIEMAVARTDRQPRDTTQKTEKAAATALPLHGDAFNTAASRRLGQLRAALGDNPKPASEPAAPSIPVRTIRAKLHRAASHTAAAVLGAGVMWYALATSIPQPVAAATPPVAPPAAVSPPPAPVSPAADTAIADMLEQWRLAWSRRDVDAYLGFYSARFVPSNGSARAAWAKERRQNLATKPAIDVQLSDVEIQAGHGDTARVTLKQDYSSGHYQEHQRPKSFTLVREDGQWRILSERQD